MGLGQMLGVGANAYTKEDSRLRRLDIAEDEADRRAVEQKELSAMRSQQLIAAKDKNKAWADGARARATEQQVRNQQLQIQGNALNDIQQMNNQRQEQQVNQLVNENKDLTRRVDNQEKISASDRTWNNVFSDLNATGKVGATGYTQINAMLEGEPAMKIMVPGKLIMFNENDENHIKGLRDLAAQQADLHGITVDEAYAPLLDTAKMGIIGFDSTTDKPWDITGLSSIMKVNNRLPSSLMDETRNKIKTSLDESASTRQQTEQVNYENQVPMPELQVYKGRKPTDVISTYKAAGLTPPEEVVKMQKANAESIGTYEEQLNESRITSLEDAIERGEATGADMAEYKQLAGEEKEARKKDMLALADYGLDRAKTKEIFSEGASVDEGDKEWMINTEGTNIKKADPMFKDARTSVRQNTSSGKRINGMLANLQEYSQSGELLTGLLATEAKDLLARDGQALEKAADLIKTADTKEAKDAARSKVNRMLRNTIKIDTPLGLELANFIKEMSGAAVSDQERDFLIDIVQGIQRGNPMAVGTALESFRDARLNRNNQYIEDPNMRTVLPSTLYEAKEAGKALRKHYEMVPVDTTLQNIVDDPNKGPIDSTLNWFSNVGQSLFGAKKEQVNQFLKEQ